MKLSQIQEILENISKNEIDKALVNLKMLLNGFGDLALERTIIQLSADYQELKNSELLGKISNDEYSLRLSKLRYYIMELTFKIREIEQEKTSFHKGQSGQGEDFITSEDEINILFDIRKILPASETYYILGYSFDRILDRFEKTFINSMKNGTHIKMIMIDPSFKDEDSEKLNAANLLIKHQVTHNFRSNAKISLNKIHQFRRALKENNEEESLFQIRFSSWIPSCSLQISNPKLKTGMMRLGIYPIWVPTNHSDIKTFKVIEKKRSPIVFKYFLDQFNNFWEDSKKESEVLEEM